MGTERGNQVTTLTGQTIFISGGIGSFGRAFIKNALAQEPKVIRVYDHGEQGLQELATEYRGESRLRFMLGDIRDEKRLRACMRDVDTVIHAAALKHVDICEYNPTECVETNVLGSINVCSAARDAGVKRLVAISTDKAVHPVSTYGASKLLMEMCLLDMQRFMGQHLKVAIIRSGNFEGSHGSVIPLWKRQYEETGRITITDKDMVRYWIGLDEIAQFVVQVLETMSGGEIFIPRMPTATIGELAHKLYPGAKVSYIGRRPGERLVEYLFGENETPEEHENYYLVRK